MHKYQVTCLQCKESEVVTVEDRSHSIMEYAKKAATNILSGRWRGDLQWGWECRCGNDNRLAASEKGDFDKLVQGDATTVQKIAMSLQVPDKNQFSMKEI